MNTPLHSQRVMESALEIAYAAGKICFRTANSRDMFELFQEWAIEFEKHPYEDDMWLELIDTYSTEMMMVAVERGIGDLHGQGKLPEINKPKTFDEWGKLHDATWIYLPKHGDRILTKGDFEKLCEDNAQRAYHLYCLCEWQNPETIIDESGGLEAMFAEEVA